MALKFSTKAGMLETLRACLESARIAPLVRFTVADWERDASSCLASVKKELGEIPYIVRSSCHREDGSVESNAGAFLTLFDVTASELEPAVKKVIAAYGKVEANDEVLIQPMLQNVSYSGVAFSHDPNTCAPYRVISWSEGSATDIVTSGAGGHTWQQAALAPLEPPAQLVGVVKLLEELLRHFDNTPLDCEFAVTETDADRELWLLQARPLVLSHPVETDEQQANRLQHIHQKISRGMTSHPFLLGKHTAYGVMPDWNPAEIVGVRPRPLALSLYRELITDSIWAYQRDNYGYRNLRSFPLMPHFFGLPYIDIRVSFNSFIPADLDDQIAGRLVDYYIDRLLEEPALHDKVEFEIVFSCYSLDLPERLNRLGKVGFSQNEQDAIATSLRSLTNRIIHPETGLWRSDAGKLETLNSRREELLNSSSDPVERIYWLLEDAKRYGTLPFAGLARAGFIAVQMLRSLVAVGLLFQSDYDAFLAGVSTVSGQLARDRTNLDKESFLAQYGHLRPGTYDILSPRYDEAPDIYFDWEQKIEAATSGDSFSLTLPQMRSLSTLLDQHGLHSDPVELLEFLQAGIELRELAKFHFSRNLSDILTLIAAYGEQHGISREEMAYCDIASIKELYVAATDPRRDLLHSIEQGKSRFAETLSTSLPPLIVQPDDVWGFQWPESEPNFITQKQVTAPVTDCSQRDALAGALVCIPNADPGYDWLFSYPIAGLITAWGGANSHMAIRAGELGLPAIIGAGEMLYRRWSAAKRLHIDCAGRRVEILA